MARRQRLWLSGRIWRRRVVFWAGAIAVGAVSVAFAKTATLVQARFAAIAGQRIWLSVLLTPLGFVFSAWLARHVFPGSQGSGIPQAIAARTLRGTQERARLLSLKLAFGKVLLTLLGLACGASIGREGPTVQVGASIMLAGARWGGMGRERGLILAGSAAGIAAAFNTPLAGIVFAIEEMSRSYESRTSFLVLSTVILAGLASLGIVGNYSYFGVTNAQLGGVSDWLALAACGILGGALGGLFSRLVLTGSSTVRAFIAIDPRRRSIAVPLACGFCVALIGLASHGATWGTGYAQARGAVEGHALAWDFAPLKLMATLLSTLSGIPGGIFAPSLSVGAGLGSVIALEFPTAPIGAVVVLGMAGYFAGVVQAPITAFVIIIEMTANHSMVIPLMCAAVLGYGTSRLICPHPLYHALAEDFIRTIGTAESTPEGTAAASIDAPEGDAEVPDDDRTA